MFCPSDQRRKSVESYGQPEKCPTKPETGGDQEDREGERGEIPEGEGDDHEAQA
jgi:hypothetical protein